MVTIASQDMMFIIITKRSPLLLYTIKYREIYSYSQLRLSVAIAG